MNQWRLSAAAALLCLAAPAWAVQPLAGFPRKVPGNAPGKDPVLVSTPIAVEAGPEGQGRIYFGAGADLHCVTLAGSICDGFPYLLAEKASMVGAPALGDLDGDKKLEVVAALSNGHVVVVRSDGTALPGFSFEDAAGFVAGCSLFDGEGGRPEILVGTKEGKLHLLGATGELPSRSARSPPLENRVSHLPDQALAGGQAPRHPGALPRGVNTPEQPTHTAE